jgi:dipeptidyl aminopeptidase/acylaminoacyl peptidase
MRVRRTLMVASFCFVAIFCAGSSAAQKFSIGQLDKVVRVSDPQIAPDGKTIVVVVSRVNFADDRYDADLVQVDVTTGHTRALTQNRRGVSSPKWSPSGDRIAFLAATVGPNPRNQIFVLPMSGGDAQQITNSLAGVQQFAWRPDGAMIAFAASDDPPKRSDEEKQNDVFEVGNDDYLIRESPMPTHVWVVAPDGTGARRLTSGKWSLPISHPPGAPSSPLAWSPDGKSIAIVRVETPSSGDSDHSTLQILDVATGAMRAVTKRAKNEGFPVWSPDGTKLAYSFPRDGQDKFGNEIFVAPASGGEGTDVTRGIDRNLARAIWLPDGKSLLVGANDATSAGLWVQPVDGGPARRVALGKVCPAGAFWVDMSVGPKGEIAFAASEPQRPGELYYLPSASGPVQRLTNFNDAVAALQLAKTETIDWDGPNNFHLDGVVTYPTDFAPGRKWPLVLYVHGGPRSASKEAFNARAQEMAAEGWVVFEPNYRGSDNLGNAFQAAIWGDAGDGPGRDVMSGVDLLKKRGWVDQTKIAVTGWSYGGYMTTWLIGHYNVWKAAIAGAPVTNWLDQYDLGDANVRRGESFGGSPYVGNNMHNFVDQSPITYAGKMKTPTLILSDVGDYRVTITQAYGLYHALKDNGVQTQFFAYPVGGHSPSDPIRQRDIDRKWLWWLHMHFDSTAASSSAGQN